MCVFNSQPSVQLQVQFSYEQSANLNFIGTSQKYYFNKFVSIVNNLKRGKSKKKDNFANRGKKNMPRCYILKKHVNQSKPTVKDKPVFDDGNTISSWQPKTSNVALKRHDTPISPTEVYASICYNNTLENQSGKCFLKFSFFSTCHALIEALTHMCGSLQLSYIRV